MINVLKSTSSNITTTKSQTAQIDYLYHISDIHIRNHNRHIEYQKVFANLCNMLKTEKSKWSRPDSGLIIITGDLVHSKSQISPQLIIETRNFLAGLCEIMPTLLIAGNHDLNMANLETPDTISGILHKIDIPDLYYLKESGIYRWLNCDFAVMSVLDYPLIKGSDFPQPGQSEFVAGQKKIGLLHATVDGSRISTSHRLLTSDKYLPSMFGDYDAVLLGDIHLHQYLDVRKRVAYAGSLIQQNFGESLRGHGYLKWQLSDCSSTLVEVANDHGYLNLFLKGDRIVPKLLPHQIPPVISVKIQIQDRSNIELAQTEMNRLKEKYQVIQGIIIPYTPSLHLGQAGKDDDDKNKPINLGLDQGLNQGSDQGSDLGSEPNQSDLAPISWQNLAGQKEVIADFLKDRGHLTKSEYEPKDKSLDQSSSGDDLLNELCATHEVFSGSMDLSDEWTDHYHWELIKLDFKNVYSYRGQYQLDFTGFKGMVGIFGANFSGKSNLLDILLFGLFDKSSRGDRVDLLTAGEKDLEIKITFRISGKQYVITRTGAKQKNGSVKIDARFANDDEDLTGENRHATNSRITGFIGTYDDFVLTTLKLQSGLGNLISLKNSERKERLIQLLRLEVWDKFFSVAWSELREVKKSAEIYQKELDGFPAGLGKELEGALQTLTEKHGIKNQIDGKLEHYRTKLVKLNKQLHPIDRDLASMEYVDVPEVSWETLEAVEEELKNINLQQNELMQKIQPTHYEYESQQEANLLLEEQNEELVEYQSELTELKTQEKKLTKVVSDLEKKVQSSRQIGEQWDQLVVQKASVENWISETEEKSKKLLDLKYDPNCHYCMNNIFVIDANKCRDELEHKRKELEKLASQYEDLLKTKKQLDEWINELQTSRESLLMLNKQRSEKDMKIREVNNIIEHLKSDLNKLVNNQQAENDLNEIKVNLSSLQQKKNSLWQDKKLWEQMQQVKQNHQWREANRSIKEQIVEVQGKIDYYAGGLSEVNGEILELTAQKEVCQTQLGRYREVKKTIAQLLQRRGELQNYVQVVGKDGVPKYLLEKYLPEFERMVNLIMQDLVDFRIQMEVSEKKWNLFVVYPDKKLNVDLCSGYEKFIVGLATKIGLFHLSQMSKPQFMIIDEGFGSFDGDNLEKLNRIYQYLRCKYQFVLMITHIDQLKDEVDEIIEVCRTTRADGKMTSQMTIRGRRTLGDQTWSPSAVTTSVQPIVKKKRSPKLKTNSKVKLNVSPN